MNYTLKAVPTAINKEQENLKYAKANQIVVGIDVHLQSYQAARKVDNAVVGVAQHFPSEAALLVYMNKQLQQARRVAAVYEAGPLGYCLYRKLKALGVECYVCAADASRQQKQRRKTNKIDARNLTSNLWNFLSGNEQALQLVRLPTVAQEQARLESREKDWLVKERKRIGARGNSVLMSQGYGSWSN